MKLFLSHRNIQKKALFLSLLLSLSIGNAWAAEWQTDKDILVAAKTSVAVPTTTNQADYEQRMADLQAQQASAEQGLILILTQNYYQFPKVDALVKEVLNQLNQAKEAEKKAQTAANQQDWSKAMSHTTSLQQFLKQATQQVSRASNALKVIQSEKLNGEQLYSDKGCNACHGVDGKNPIQPSYPVIAGQAQDYLVTQMMAIKSGARDNGQTALMKGIIAAVKPAEMNAIAKWLASFETPTSEINFDTAGALLYFSKSCQSCHGENAKTPLLGSYPKLLGQNESYLLAQMTDIQSGARSHDQTRIMKPLVQSLTDMQWKAIAGWLAEPGQQTATLPKLNGEQLYSDKGCHVCHGVDGKNPIQSSYPMIAGQAQDYLVTQMMAIKSGARDNGQTALMKGIIATVKPAEMNAIAKWLASLETPISEINYETAGAWLYLEQSCHSCHGENAKTPLLGSYPKLLGQNESYVLAQMTDIQSGARSHDQTRIMKPLVQTLTEVQWKAIAGWLAEPGQQTETLPELNGEQLYSDKGCNACHGVDGKNPIQPSYPVIAGQTQDYLVTQMKAIKSGARDNGQTALMKGIIAAVKPAEMNAIAKWLASFETPTSESNFDTAGAQLYFSKSCHSCHGENAKTPLLGSYPKLVGQNESYLLAQMTDIQSGARSHDQTRIMKPLVQTLTDEQWKTIADWLAATDK
jgi:cytochrome c553